jgi:hypothetical protein
MGARVSLLNREKYSRVLLASKGLVGACMDATPRICAIIYLCINNLANVSHDAQRVLS